jgi:hypothetical protein
MIGIPGKLADVVDVIHNVRDASAACDAVASDDHDGFIWAGVLATFGSCSRFYGAGSVITVCHHRLSSPSVINVLARF